MVTIVKNKTIVLGLSGGLDSTILLGYLLEQDCFAYCVYFSYGANNIDFERQAAQKIMAYYAHLYPNKVRLQIVDINSLFELSRSGLVTNQVPMGFQTKETIKKVYLPGRNLIFSSILASIAENIQAQRIALGLHSGVGHIYADCTTTFVQDVSRTIKSSTGGKVEVYSPFITLTRSDIIYSAVSFKQRVPFELTRTCYTNFEQPCGKCNSCLSRIGAFKVNNIKDPIKYE